MGTWHYGTFGRYFNPIQIEEGGGRLRHDISTLKLLISVLHFSQQAQARLAGENVTRLLGTSEYINDDQTGSNY